MTYEESVTNVSRPFLINKLRVVEGLSPDPDASDQISPDHLKSVCCWHVDCLQYEQMCRDWCSTKSCEPQELHFVGAGLPRPSSTGSP